MDKLIYEVLLAYSNLLKAAGYVPYKEVYNIIVLLFLYDTLDNEFATKEDKIKILSGIRKLSKCSCLIPVVMPELYKCIQYGAE